MTTIRSAREYPAGSPYLDFGARMYSPDCARWLSVDPMAEKNYGIGTHVYCAGDPVNIFDLQGRKIYFANGVRESFKGKFAEAVDYMNECGTSYNIAALEQSDQVYYVTEGEINQYDPNTHTVSWNPNVVSINRKTGKARSPVTSLAHEFSHARHHDNAIANGEVDQFIENSKDNSDSVYGSIEEREVITKTEQYAARRHGEIIDGEVTRLDHGGRTLETVHVNNKVVLLNLQNQKWISHYVQAYNKMH